MKKIITKRHPVNFYLLIIFCTIFYLVLGTGLLIKFSHLSKASRLTSKDQFIPLLCVVIYFLAAFTIFKYFKNAPIVEVDKIKITIGKQCFYWDEIKEIVLDKKQPFNYLVDYPTEGIALYLKDETVKYIFEGLYSNGWELKSFIKYVIVDKKEMPIVTTQRIDNQFFENECFNQFKGNQFFSWRGVIMWGFTLWVNYILLFFPGRKITEMSAILFDVCISLFWFGIFSATMNYFLVSEHFLLIKNHNFFWKKKIYKLSDINEIVFETQGKMPNCLRIIKKDFRNKLYPAATLSNKKWLLLKDELEKKNIIVRNECIHS